MGEEPPTPLSCAATSKRSSRCSPLRRRSTVGGRDVGESEFARELNRHIRAVAEQLGAGHIRVRMRLYEPSDGDAPRL